MFLSLTDDAMFVNGNKFMKKLSRKLKFITVEHTQNITA